MPYTERTAAVARVRDIELRDYEKDYLGLTLFIYMYVYVGNKDEAPIPEVGETICIANIISNTCGYHVPKDASTVPCCE